MGLLLQRTLNILERILFFSIACDVNSRAAAPPVVTSGSVALSAAWSTSAAVTVGEVNSEVVSTVTSSLPALFLRLEAGGAEGGPARTMLTPRRPAEDNVGEERSMEVI